MEHMSLQNSKGHICLRGYIYILLSESLWQKNSFIRKNKSTLIKVQTALIIISYDCNSLFRQHGCDIT